MPAVVRAPARPLRHPAGALLLALALAACGGGADPEASGPAPTTVQPSLPSVASDVSQAGVPLLVSVTARGGAVTGATGPVRVALNTPVRLTVLADVADKVLVTGYELRTQVTVDEPVQLTFIASKAGSFEVTLEQTGTVLTRLDVR